MLRMVAINICRWPNEGCLLVNEEFNVFAKQPIKKD